MFFFSFCLEGLGPLASFHSDLKLRCFLHHKGKRSNYRDLGKSEHISDYDVIAEKK
jgi:hypothetical protein